MLVYLLKSTACLLAFMLFYKLVLEQQKMHQFNRFYLIGTLLLSFGIPLVTFTKIVEVAPVSYQEVPEVLQFSSAPMSMVEIVETVNYVPIVLGIVYSIGFLIFLSVFIKNLIALGSRIRKNEKQQTAYSVRVLMQKEIIPHTFLKYIFLNKEALQKQEIPDAVLLHEEAHVQQKHSLDILFVEFLKVIFWFNPLIYFIKHSIKLNHEFLADEAVLQTNVDASFYKKILLEFSIPNNNHQSEPLLANSINYSSIKKRFTVMKKRTSKKSVWLRSLLFLPLIAVLIYGFSNKKTKEVVAQSNQNALTEQITPQNTQEGASEKMMQEYRDYVQKYQKATKKVVMMGEYKRIVAIYDLMTPEQKASVLDHRTIIKQFNVNLTKTKRRKPSQGEYNSWKNGEKFAIWIDGKNVPNKALNNYTVDDIEYFSNSFVYNNARTKRHPQPYQNHLYTKKGFEETYLKSGIKKYNRLKSKYLNAIKDKSLGKDELRILKVQVDKAYKVLTKDEIEKYSVGKIDWNTPNKKQNSNTLKKALMNSVSTINNNIQQKATPEQIAEYNRLAKQFSKNPNGLIKSKDVKRIKYLYSLMSDEQKKGAESFPKITPPPPPPAPISPKAKEASANTPPPPAMDTISTYNSLAKRAKLIPNNRKNNLQYLIVLFNKMSDSNKEKVENPSSISKYISQLNN